MGLHCPLCLEPWHLLNTSCSNYSKSSCNCLSYNSRNKICLITYVYNALRQSKPNSAAGPDNLPSVFFHHTAPSIALPLSILFQSFSNSHSLPSEWKHSIITPKHKKGPLSNPQNYRPISLTCACSKIFESIISSGLLDFLSSNRLISPHQHGFLKKHSTTTNLLESVNDWTLSIDIVDNHHHTTIACI